MFCFYCSKDTTFFEDTGSGDSVCTRCGSCDFQHVTFGDNLPRRLELNPTFCPEETKDQPKKETKVIKRGRPRKSKETQEELVVNDPFMASLKELSRFVCIDRRDICRYHKAVLRFVEKDPTLRFVLPTAVVLAVYSGANEVSQAKPPNEVSQAKRSERSEPSKASKAAEPGEASEAKSLSLEDLCAALKLKVCTVNRILKEKINLKNH